MKIILKKIKNLEHEVIVKGTTNVSKHTKNGRKGMKNMINLHIIHTVEI